MSPALTPSYAPPSYASVTEQPGQPASQIQLEMLGARYAWAAEQACRKDVLEAGCGAGLGLPVLAGVARFVDGGDVDAKNLRAAQATCAGHPNITLREFHAEQLPFPNGSFDLVLLFEAIYYLVDVGRFFGEAQRVLRPGGALLIVTVNPEWTGFNPSPLKTRYWTSEDLLAALRGAGFMSRAQGAFPEANGWAATAIGLVRRVAVALNLLPRTMEGKALLKRIFCGPLKEVPWRVSASSLRPRLEELDATGSRHHRVLYVTARKDNV